MININKLKLTILQQEILRLMFIKLGHLTQRRIAKILEVSPPAVMKALPQLEKENLLILHQDKESKRWDISLNRDNHKVIQLKRVDNLKQVYESGLNDFIEDTFAGATIILFGSFAKGEDVFSSDIDIAIVGRKEKLIDLEKFEKLLEREINLNFYNSFSDIHKHLKANLFNGIILSGSVEL